MKKIAFIVQQYGLEMCGGAEFHCMQLAERMNKLYEVEILTTCSLNFLTWDNYYEPGKSVINDVVVRRFPVSQLRNSKAMEKLERKVKNTENLPQSFLYRGVIGKLVNFVTSRRAKTKDYFRWVIEQGPTAPSLIKYLENNENEYDCLIFFTYLYYPTIFGISSNPAKTIFIPLAHDEWALRMPIFKKIFHTPAFIMYNTLAEKKLVNKLFNNELVDADIAGVGVDSPVINTDFTSPIIQEIVQPYILYIGRIDSNKITDTDFKWFIKYNNETENAVKLVLIGKLDRELPKSSCITYLGFVDTNTKYNLLKNCMFLFQPSRFESLSMVLLESFKLRKPVLAHEKSEVMKDHIDSSGGGFYYKDYDGFKTAINKLVNDKELNISMGNAGKAYVDKNYTWEKIISKFKYVIDNKICSQK